MEVGIYQCTSARTTDCHVIGIHSYLPIYFTMVEGVIFVTVTRVGLNYVTKSIERQQRYPTYY